MKNNNLDFGKFDTKEVRIQSYKRFDESIFKDVFENALCSVEEIIGHIKAGDEDSKKEVNNIIAFTGERGTGKTTAMVSFVNYLQKDIREDSVWKPKSIAKEYNFQCVPLIDPSKLTADENMITLVVAYIYESIKEIAHKETMYSRNNAGKYMEKLKEGVRKCQEIYDVVCVKYTSFSKNIEQNPDTVETFSEIAKATRVRELIQELVDIYLNILNGENDSKKSILIIPIDDLDTNIKNAYTLAEDLRSCFMVSKVIIMMAVKLEQLNDVMQLKFCEDFKNLSSESQRMDSSAETMATKYLEKLIAYDRRIAMPSLTFQSLNSYTITTRYDESRGCRYSILIRGLRGENQSEQSENEEPLVQYTLGVLYQKTGIILVANERNVHEFIPCNLRTLHQLLQTLEAQEDISLQDIIDFRKEGKEEELLKKQQILSSNLEKIYNFLLDNATNGSMSKELVEILRRLGQQPIDIMNAFLVRSLCNALGDSAVGKYIRENPVIINFASLNVHPHLITVGDVLYLLNEMEQADSEFGTRQFAMTVKMIYSITMIRLLFAQGIEPQYSAASQLLGSTICNPAIQLLPGRRGIQSYEWMPRVKGDKIAIRIKDELYTLDGENINDRNTSNDGQEWNILSISTIVRMSFFVLGYHRMKRSDQFRQIDPHLYDQGDYPLVKYRRSAPEDINSALLALHWMSFVSLSLNPSKTIDAMLHCFKGDLLSEVEEYKELQNEIEVWREENICAIPIYSMDILNELIYDMHEKRFEYDDGTAKDKRLHGYICFMESLKASLKSVWERTNIKDETIENRLYQCPVLFPVEKEGDHIEEELKWLNE